jgi:hypothetical protein
MTMRQFAVMAVVLLASLPAGAQTVASRPSGEHAANLGGVWNGHRAPGGGSYGGYGFSEELPPMTAWAMERYQSAKPTFGPTSVSVADTNDPVYQCFPPGTPRIYFHPFPMEIIELPGRIMMVFEYDHLIRQIYTDGRGHRDDLAPGWMGDSIGFWEGDTLVVETTNFNDKTWVDRRGVPHSEQLRVVERIHVNDEGLLQIDITVEDPVAFTASWTGQRFYERVDWNIEEFVCMDNVTFLDFEQEVLDYVE